MASLWVASAPPGGRLGATRVIPSTDVEGVLAKLFATGSGYLEIGIDDDAAPLLLLGAATGLAVMHLQHPGGERMSLMVGDGSLGATETVDVQIIDDLARFAGSYVMQLDHALSLVRRFVLGEDALTFGEWHEL